MPKRGENKESKKKRKKRNRKFHVLNCSNINLDCSKKSYANLKWFETKEQERRAKKIGERNWR